MGSCRRGRLSLGSCGSVGSVFVILKWGGGLVRGVDGYVGGL